MRMSPIPNQPTDLPMDLSTARLEALLQRHAAALDPRHGDGALSAEFREDLRMLVAEYGQPAIDVALGDLPDALSPSVSRH
jgi:hypothetical protein